MNPQQLEIERAKYGIPAQGFGSISSSTNTAPKIAVLDAAWSAAAKQQQTDHEIRADQATFPVRDASSGIVGTSLKAVGNIPGSTVNFVKGVVDLYNPVSTLKKFGDYFNGFDEYTKELGGDSSKAAFNVVKEFPTSAYKLLVPQFLQHAFSGEGQKAAETVINDPVGQILPLLMVARGAAQSAGKVAEFDNAISTIAKPVTYAGSKLAEGAGELASQAFGATTGTGASTIKVAAEGTPEFTSAMRGNTSAEDVVRSAENVVQNIKTNRASAYQADLKAIGEDTASHDISPVQAELQTQLGNFGVKVTDEGGLDFSRSSIANNGAARGDIQGIYKTLKEWGAQSGDRTGIGLDTLKRQLGDFYSDSGQARAFVQAIKGKVTDILNKEVPGYKDMTSKYATASDLLDDIKSATGAGSKAKADTIFTKLTTAMKGDKEFRLAVLKEMENAGEPALMDKIAGVNMRSFVPKGLVGRGIDVITAYQILQGAFSAKFLPMLLATSPRIVGEFVRALGYSATKSAQILKAVNNLAPYAPSLSAPATVESNQQLLQQQGQ